ncbi:hypothetical protein T4D_14451 [Trichinella pseudospiralis]|uniref:Uncharacterized protein n=1 Tax=Trichinella pseudospiralis TaxID=6337 RepID=A0A0V1FSL5_TRIPS|nr:hypothetical protein T4D_14451 [Trichinella pseudospiralis]
MEDYDTSVCQGMCLYCRHRQFKLVHTVLAESSLASLSLNSASNKWWARILAPGVAPGYAPGHKKICICLEATPLAFYCTIFALRNFQIFENRQPKGLPQAMLMAIKKFA